MKRARFLTLVLVAIVAASQPACKKKEPEPERPKMVRPRLP